MKCEAIEVLRQERAAVLPEVDALSIALQHPCRKDNVSKSYNGVMKGDLVATPTAEKIGGALLKYIARLPKSVSSGEDSQLTGGDL